MKFDIITVFTVLYVEYLQPMVSFFQNIKKSDLHKMFNSSIHDLSLTTT